MAGSGALDAAAIVGLLADDDRRRAVAALELGARTVSEVQAAAGLDGARATRALGRLASGGLVVADGDAVRIVAGAFARAARVALERPASTEHAAQPVEVRRVLDAFVSGGRLATIPAARAKRRVVLDWLAQDFEPGRRYSEAMVNLVLGRRHADTAALRRYLVDEGFLAREAGEYWRVGGSVGAPG